MCQMEIIVYIYTHICLLKIFITPMSPKGFFLVSAKFKNADYGQFLRENMW